jgi:alkanesulfonate monooxygenase SsuD/methylene tetrahydromethanopterin reductase-like flavin-dependent oxidoreductase (luciferase family)
MTDPTILISTMAAVTRNLTFGITASTSFEPPFLLARRFSTLDRVTKGRIGWSIVASWKKAAFKAIGIDTSIEHDERYLHADEYLGALYELWEGFWSDEATIAGVLAEPIFVSSHSPALLRPKVDNIRRLAAEQDRDPRSIKVFATFTCILGQTDEEAKAKLERHAQNASTIGGLVLFSGWTGVDISKILLDQKITASGSKEAHKATSILSAFTTTSKDAPEWNPRVVAEKASIGGLGPVGVGSPATVADEMERWIEEGDLDGFNLAYVTTPSTFEDIVDLLIPELRRRGLYPEKVEDGLWQRPVAAARRPYW